MKKLIALSFSLLLSVVAVSQPNKIAYQAVVRDAQGNVRVNTSVDLKFSFTNEQGTVVHYVEEFAAQTNQFGLVTVELGGGNAVQGSFSAIPWSSGSVYLKVEVKEINNWVLLGSRELLSVPYALFAKDGNRGDPGVGIANTTLNPDSTLTLTFTDLTSYTTPIPIIGRKGEKGDKGDKGEKGDQGEAGTAGANGISIQWLGSLDAPPANPQLNQGYYNNVLKVSYIWDGDSWEVISQDGVPGAQGPVGPQGPQGPQGPAGTGLNNRGNWVLGTKYGPNDYVFAENTSQTGNSMWIMQASDSIVSTTPPREDSSNWVEFEAPAGPKGDTGDPGISIQWLGTYPAYPSSPQLNQAFFHSVEKKSFVWDGDSWEILAQDGEPGPPGPLVSGTSGQTLRHDGTGWVASSTLFNNVSNVGINTSSPTQTLHVSGNLRLTGHLYDYNNTNGTTGQILRRGASGVEWQTPAWPSGSGTNGNMAIWNGTSTLSSLPNLTFSNSLVVQGNPTANPDDPIFEVKNSNGEVIFGVYQEGVRINIADSPIKGAKGGFAVGGLTNQTKAGPVEYLRITPDSARIYIKQDAAFKGAKGGFAVGGLTNQTKTVVSQDLFFINPDSARIYLHETVQKGAKGGFAVGGLTNLGKGSNPQLIQLTKDNYLIGYEAGKSITTGTYNSFLGYQSGMSNNVGSWNTFLGYQAGLNNTGSDNTFIGYQAGLMHQDRGGNVYIGSKAGKEAPNGEQNIFIGESAGYKNNGSKNIGLGFEAGYNTTTGSRNIFIGVEAGRNNNTGNNNIVLGEKAGYSLTSGSDNTLIGTLAGYNHTSQQYNVMIGTAAGYNLNSTGWNGSFNTFVGINAGYKIQSSKENVFLGTNAGYMLESGNSNTIVGIDAGRGGNDDPNNYHGYSTFRNTFLGCQAGRNLLTGNDNVFIGYQAGYSETNTTGKLYIANSGSNPPLIYGDFTSKKLGINTKTLTSTLNVGGDLTVTGGITASTVSANLTGNVTGDVTGNVSGSAGNIGGVKLGKIYLSGDGTVISTANGNIILSKSGTQLRLTNNTGGYIHLWWQAQQGSTQVGNSIVVNSPVGSYQDLTNFTANGQGMEIHFGKEDGSTYCSVWLQYSNGKVFGHYMMY